MVSWIGMRQVAVRYDRDERGGGQTNYPFGHMLLLAIDAITSFSTRPLHIASLVGLGFGFLGFLGVAYAVVGWAIGQTVPGWTSVIVVVMTLAAFNCSWSVSSASTSADSTSKPSAVALEHRSVVRQDPAPQPAV